MMGLSLLATTPIKTYKDLNVFKESYRLALDVSKSAKRLPVDEQFEIGRQRCRAARSVPANIVEGWAKRAWLQSSSATCRFRLVLATNANSGWN
jgi:hypothetical protein